MKRQAARRGVSASWFFVAGIRLLREPEESTRLPEAGTVEGLAAEQGAMRRTLAVRAGFRKILSGSRVAPERQYIGAGSGYVARQPFCRGSLSQSD